MGVLIRKQKGLVFTKICKLAFVGFFMALSFALIDTVWALYMEGYFHNISYVGFFSGALTFVSLISYFFFIPLIERSKKTKIFAFSILLFSISYFLFSINTKFYIFVILAFIISILHTLRITSFGIIVHDNSEERQLSRNEGLLYTFYNIAWVIGPLISGYLLWRFGINLIFNISGILIFSSLLIFLSSKIKNSNKKKRLDNNMLKNFIMFFKDKQRKISYILSGGVNFWWSLIYLFMPIYIINNNLPIFYVGYFLFAVAIPLILFEYPASKLAGKVGFKKMFKIGFFILFLIALLCFFITNIYILLILLVFASIGISILEPTTESHFFDILKNKKEELRYYGPYNTTIEFNNFIGRMLSAVLLLFLPFRYIFLFFSLAMFIFFLISFKVKNVVEKKRDGKLN